MKSVKKQYENADSHAFNLFYSPFDIIRFYRRKYCISSTFNCKKINNENLTKENFEKILANILECRIHVKKLALWFFDKLVENAILLKRSTNFGYLVIYHTILIDV